MIDDSDEELERLDRLELEAERVRLSKTVIADDEKGDDDVEMS